MFYLFVTFFSFIFALSFVVGYFTLMMYPFCTGCYNMKGDSFQVQILVGTESKCLR